MKTVLLSLIFFCTLYFSYAQSGELDPAFGAKGIVITDIGTTFNYKNVGDKILMLADGSFYLVFEVGELTLITKKHSNGSTDSTYGKNGMSVSAPLFNSQAILQADGKIVITGATYNSESYVNFYDFAVARFNTNGTLDTTFDGDGIAVTDFGDSDYPAAVAIGTNGKIFVAGTTVQGSGGTFIAIARYNTNGALELTYTDQRFDQFANSLAIQSDGKLIIAGVGLMRYTSNLKPDSSFNGNGLQLITGVAAAVAIQKDGKIVVAGNLSNADYDTFHFALARYNLNGSLDKTFSGDGLQTTNFSNLSIDAATTIAFQTDGKIILGGYTTNDTNINFALARYTTNGILDNSFSGDGKQLTDFGSSNDYISNIAVQSDGKILAFGYTSSESASYIAAARYNLDGTPDNTFDTDGKLTDHIIQGSTFYTSTAVQNDGKVITAGYAWNGINYDFALARYNTNGILDITFSGDGKQVTTFGHSDNKIKAILVQNDGKILVAGLAGDSLALARYTANGNLDVAFSNDGKQTAFYGTQDSASAIAIQKDGKIVVAGSVLARYNVNGLPDPKFNGGDKVLFDFSATFRCNDVTIQPDGKIVIAGFDDEFAIIARYDTNGLLDNTFGTDGVRFIYEADNYPYEHLALTSVKIQQDGSIIAGGYNEHTYRILSSRYALLRLDSLGNLDYTFNGGEIVFTSILFNNYATSMVIQPDDKIILAGYSYNGSSNDFTLARFNTDGSLDDTFSGDGKQSTEPGTAYDKIAGISLLDNKLYVAGYGQNPGNTGVVARYLLGPEAGPLAAVFTTVADGNWNDPLIWIGKVVPSAKSQVIVKNNVIISSNANCYSLKVIAPGGRLTVSTGANLSISH